MYLIKAVKKFSPCDANVSFVVQNLYPPILSFTIGSEELIFWLILELGRTGGKEGGVFGGFTSLCIRCPPKNRMVLTHRRMDAV
jgi:hypothetical protein